ncbi:putative flavin-containing monooxygenase [Phaeomoniella chlamydospora]|uniref:Putative flavin-containing monooxygenase n=1 Tax=Phaeomoniella chlamydospora TaxID=158046 RepID=A0A0G2EX46_PHACM|nr:putative flavin-containing monooxygenase [Phaeomoniella chlamydospora]
MAAVEKLAHTIQLPQYSKVSSPLPNLKAQSPREIAQRWLNGFAGILLKGDASDLQNVIHPEAWWRDHLAITWDFRTLSGLPKIIESFGPKLCSVNFHDLALAKEGKFAPHEISPIDGLDWVESMFSFETAVGSGKGMIRLVSTPEGVWKAHMIYTSLQELRDHKWLEGDLRPHGGNNSLKGGAIEGNWYERRQRQREFLDDEPKIFVIGAGQSGLNIAARLQALGLSCLVIDKNERVGDNWRHRYRTLVTHDPVQYTHLSYLKFPTNWPLFTPKDKLADWFEIYASAMELNVWLSTTVQKAEFSDEEQSWTVVVKRGDATSRTLRPKQIVFCTGHAGEPKIPVFPGQESFGGVVYHGSQHKDASFGDSVPGKKVVVVGTGNSGHDIAQNYYENGASVQMLQRSGTYIISAKTGLFMLHKGLYDEHGPPTEDADVFGQSLPIPVQFALNVGLTTDIKAAEQKSLEGLEKAGFKLDYGHDGSGIYRKYVTRGGGYCIDVGASQLIIDGKIRVVQSPDGIQGFEKDGIVLADGRKLEADIVVLATGYDNMRTSVRKVLGDAVADRCKDVWNLDDEGEVNAMWRPSGHPRFWFMGGSLALCRLYSKFLALQIKATEEGLIK